MTTRKAQREATRERVLAAAERLFAARGFEATTVREIAADAEVSVGTVMAVGDKAAILVELFDRRIAAIHEAREREGPRTPPPAGRPVDEILAALQPCVELFYGDVELARHYAATLVTGTYAAGVFNELAEVLRGEIAEVLVRNGFPPDAAARGASAVYLAYLGTLFVGAGNGGSDPTGPVEELVSALEFLTGNHNQGREKR